MKMKTRIRNIGALFAMLILVGGCASPPPAPSPPASGAGASPSDALNQVAAGLADQLVRNRQIKGGTGTRIAVGSFVNITKLDETDSLGMSVAEFMMHHMHLRGFSVIDFKVRETPRVRPSGDFMFSRDIADLKRNHSIHYYLSGTISHNGDGAVINARLIQAENNLVVSTAQGYLPNMFVDRIFSDHARSSNVERMTLR